MSIAFVQTKKVLLNLVVQQKIILLIEFRSFEIIFSMAVGLIY